MHQAPPFTTLRRLRSLARLRRRFGWAVVLIPALCVVGVDLLTRGDRLLGLSGRYVASYGAAAVESAMLWGLLLVAASARRGAFRWIAAGLFVALATLSVGGQLYFHEQYATYLNLDATLFGTSFSESLFSQWQADARNFAGAMWGPLVLAVALVWLGRRMLRPAPRTASVARWVAPVAVVAVFVIPCSYRTVQASTPDVIYFHAVGGLLRQITGISKAELHKPGLRNPPRLEPIVAAPARPRNVLLVITEAVRADAHCSVPAETCPIAPEVNAAVPSRSPLTQLRSTSSATAIQLAVMWSGLMPTESREDLHAAPLLFDFAHAAGYQTAYWTSHHMMFANSRLWVQDLPTRFQCGATDLDPLADIDLGARDDLLTKRIQEELPQLERPFFAVAHFGNTHVPYLVDPDDAPFQPALASKAEADNEAYRNTYKNAVYLQDKAIGALLRFVRSDPALADTVILFTSDHGEAFREHGQLGHTGSMYDEEIHVPGWVDAPSGTLTDAEREALAAHRDRPVLHTDIAPTILDLLGLWESKSLEPFRRRMVGASWVRPPTEPPRVAVTNCSGVWGCAFRNWGVVQGTKKLIAREWDLGWRCYDVATDPREERDLGVEACADLVDWAHAVHGGRPHETDAR